MSEHGLAPPGAAMTVLGPGPAETVGQTLMHEHLLCAITLPGLRGVPHKPVMLANRFDSLDRQPAPGAGRAAVAVACGVVVSGSNH